MRLKYPLKAFTNTSLNRLTPANSHRHTASGLALVMMLSLANLVGTAPAYADTTAQQTTQEFSIPAGALDAALARFGQQSGVLVSVSGAASEGKQTQGLEGDYSVDQALELLLQGTGLRVVRQGNGSYVVESSADGVMMLSPVKVSANSLETTTEGTGSYTTGYSSYGKGQSLKELPQTVSIITHERIEDEGLTLLDDVLAQTPGVTIQQQDTAQSSFYARGFEITNFQFDGNSSLSGGTFGSGYNTNQLDLAMFDSIEVLRGSDALYGNSGEPGGAINLVRKKPTKEFQLSALVSAGRWNNYRNELDAGGPIAMGGKIRGRLVGVYENREYFYDAANSDKSLIYGIVEADITDSTLITIGGNIMRQDGTYMRHGLPRYSNGSDIGLPRRTFLGTTDDRWLRKNNNLFARINQSLGGDWSLSIEASRSESENTREDFLWFGSIDPITYSGLYSRLGGLYSYNETQATFDVVLKGSFHLLGGEHAITLGGNSNKLERPTTIHRRDSNSGIVIPNIFEFNPDDYRSDDPYYPFAGTTTDISQKGIYGSLAAEITDPLTLIVGGRIGWYEYDYMLNFLDQDTGDVTSSSPTLYEDNDVITPYVGLVYDLSADWSAYASFAETYQSQASSLKGPLPGTALDPIKGNTFEIGLKGSLFNERLNTNIALYSIKREGEAVEDPAYPYTPGDLGSSCCYLDEGEIVSQGVDIEISGEIADGWQIQAGYTYNDNENKADNSQYSTITPKHLFKLWTSYEMKGPLDGLKLGGGVTAQSENYVSGTTRTYNNTTGMYDGPSVDYEFTEPGRVLVDLFAQYRFDDHWTAAINVNNVFDKTYYETVGTTEGYNWYGEPRNFLLSVKYSH